MHKYCIQAHPSTSLLFLGKMLKYAVDHRCLHIHLQLMLYTLYNMTLRCYSCSSECMFAFFSLLLSSCALYFSQPFSLTLSPSRSRNSSNADPALSLLYMSSSVLCPARQYITPTLRWKFSYTHKHTYAYTVQWLDCLSVLSINNNNSNISQQISLITYVPLGMCDNTKQGAIWNPTHVFVVISNPQISAE